MVVRLFYLDDPRLISFDVDDKRGGDCLAEGIFPLPGIAAAFEDSSVGVYLYFLSPRVGGGRLDFNYPSIPQTSQSF